MKINLSHGNGGKEMQNLLETVFIPFFKNPLNEIAEDSAIISDLNLSKGKLAFTTDSYVVKPLFFSGGDIGRLAVCGTVNDLLTSGARPLYLSASFIIEEGMETDTLLKIVRSMKETADEAGVSIITGDTKVIEGNGGLYINTSGIGIIEKERISFKSAKAGDRIIVTGNLGNHHACILSERMSIKNNIKSDLAPLCEIVNGMIEQDIIKSIHGMRDITRGGLATVLNEAVGICGLNACIEEKKLPVSEEVKGLSSILGLDPLYMGNEGCMLLFVEEEAADKVVDIIRSKRYGENAGVIGKLSLGSGVVLKINISGKRILPLLSGQGLPRIC